MPPWAEPTNTASIRPGCETSSPTSPDLGLHQLSPALRFLLVVYVGADWQRARAAHSARWSNGIAAVPAWCEAVERQGLETPRC